MAQTAHLEIVVTSGGVQSASKDLKELTATAKETEKSQQHLASVFAEVAAAEEKEAAKAIAAATKKADAQEKAAQKAAAAAEQQASKAAATAEREAARQTKQIARENEQWNDAIQKAIARNEKRAESAERSAKREADAWNNAIQRAKAGLDGVLPIRPSLQRIEAKINEPQSAGGSMSGILAGGKEGAMSALGLGALAGGAASLASAAVTTVIESVKGLSDAVIQNVIEDDKLVARLGGLTNSAEAANETFEDLRKQTLGKLPSTVDEVANAFIQLGNNGLQNGQSALKSYSNIAAQTGASLGDVTRAVQMATLGNYRSLREFGIKVKEEGDNLQVTFRGQTETIAGGAESIEAYLQRLGSVEFGGAVERQMETIGGTVKKTHDAWERFIESVSESSLGALIASTVGSSIGVIDAMTASVDALFDRVEKGKRELESDKRKREEDAALDKTMMSWGDPTQSKSETARLADVMEEHRQASADKTLAIYTKQLALIERMIAAGETQLGTMSLERRKGVVGTSEAEKELTRQYMRDNGGDKKEKATSYAPNIGTPEDSGYARYQAMRVKQDAEELRSVREALSKKEDAERESYETRRAFLVDYTGPDSEALWAKNTDLWEKHLDEVAAKSAKAQLELQKRLQNIGLGPQSHTQAINNKYAGQSLDLEAALSDNMSGKNGEVLKLAAEQTYAQKSVEIEKARAREIAQVNRDLVQQSAQNASLIFGGLATAMKNAHGEQSKEYKLMFAAQQAFAIATAEVAMFTDMAKANEAGFPANVPLYLKAAADGAAIIAQVSNVSYGGAYDAGGTIGEGRSGDVGERRPELLMVSGRTRVQGPATVIGGEATAALLGGKQQQPVRIVNVPEGGDVFRGHMGSSDERVILNVIKRNGPFMRSITR